MREHIFVVGLLAAIALALNPVHAQDASGITGAVFTNPGARSIGLGGAFAAIADDATAAFANPAGLAQILRPEISIEIRGTASRSDHDNPYGLDNDLSGLGFFSFVYPSQRWALALYSHQLASVGFTYDYPGVVTRELTVQSYAAAAAFEVSEHLSLGVGLSYFDGDRTEAAGVSGFSDSDWGVNAGALWNISQTWNIAGFYRQGPEFDSLTAPSRFSFPTEYGVGVAFRPKAGALTVGFEWDRVGRTVDPLFDGRAETEGGSEWHLGAEYAVLQWKPVPAFRIGWWREPGGQREVFSGSRVEETYDEEDRVHMALGVGVAFKRFQIDVGADISKRAVVGSASFVYSF